MQLKIVHFSQDFRSEKPQLGGYSRIINICRDNNIHYIFTLSFNSTSIIERNLYDNIKVIELPLDSDNFRLRNQVFGIKKLANRILSYIHSNRIDVDILFGHSQLVNFFILNRVKNKLKNKIPIIWEMNAVWGHRTANSNFDKVFLKILSFIQKHVIDNSDVIILHSDESKKFVLSKFKLKNFNKLFVIKNAIAQEEIISEDLINQINNPVKFICIGFFDEMNGIPMLVHHLKERTDKIDISFFGSGKFEKLVSDLMENGKCHFGGIIPRDEMIAKLKFFDFIIIPRLPHKEADLFIPTKLIEAMANGVIPICSDVKGMTEVIIHMKNGMIFNAGDFEQLDRSINIARSLSSDELIKLKKNALRTIRNNYCWSKNHVLLYDIYINSINEKRLNQ